MKTLFTIIISIILTSTCFAQKDLLPAYPNEISFRGEIAYFNGSPFTGLLVEEKTNKKLGAFKNGYKEGIFTEYYSNGKKKFEGKYKNGLKDGVHTEWFENKQQKSSYKYNNGEIVDGIYVTFLENGEKDKEETYKNGKIIKEGMYQNGQYYELSTLYFSDGETKKSEGYLKDGEKDGMWTDWYESGQINSEGNYTNGKKDSLWTWWYYNGEKKKEAIYENGNLTSIIYENNVDPAFSINAKLKSNSYLFRSVSGVDEDTSFVMVLLNFDKRNNFKSIEENIIWALKLRLELIPSEEIPIYGKKILGYSIEFSSPKIFTIYYDKASATEILGAFLGVKFQPGYRGKVAVLMEVSNLNNNTILLKDTLEGESDKYKTQNEALLAAPTLVRQNIINQIYHVFKIKTSLYQILEADGDGEAETVSIMLNQSISIGEKFIFDIYSENDLTNKIGEIEASEIKDDMIECEVNEGGEIIGSKMRSGIRLIAISKY